MWEGTILIDRYYLGSRNITVKLIKFTFRNALSNYNFIVEFSVIFWKIPVTEHGYSMLLEYLTYIGTQWQSCVVNSQIGNK